MLQNGNRQQHDQADLYIYQGKSGESQPDAEIHCGAAFIYECRLCIQKISEGDRHTLSDYLTNERIQKAKEYIENEEMDRISDIAERVGFGNNPQYFFPAFQEEDRHGTQRLHHRAYADRPAQRNQSVFENSFQEEL